MPDHDVLFGASLGQWNGADAADAAGRVRLATQADRDGLDLFTVADHPYFGDKLDAYALTGFLLGQTERITGMVTVTNLPSRPAPVLARTLTSLSVLSGGGDPVTFDGEFYHVDGLDPAAAQAPRVFTGSVGPKSLAVTGQLADGWIPPGGSDWLSQLYRESRPRVDAAAAAAGRDPADIADVYNFGGRITPEPLAATRGEDGRWIGGSVRQWVDELTTAVLDHHAAGFIYRSPDDTPAGEALARWATEVVPAVREAITR